ncbi:pilus assembly protein [Sulfitobacter albidus]|uniref:Pilus assembly protein n=1 Tax=Sulfitobacter albidus TaxID=2829501 RepID=A0A975JBH6_9RHOB|nr:TadE family protein [Sulfitobacter albidus]QUJ75205.1 pilus assembly protein [Sulfitobacter albidus]
MITRLKNRFRIFRKAENGAVVALEFMIMLPLIFGTFFMGFEMGIYSIRQLMLDRALEVTTRDVRLNTQATFSHDDLRTAICANSGGLDKCDENLKLEMLPMDPRDFTGLPANPDCENIYSNATPVRGWSLGQQHELMILRACYRFKPVFPTTGLGYYLEKNSNGEARMVSITAFVQEPS